MYWDALHLVEKETKEFPPVKVPRQCPLVLLVKAGWKGSKTLRIGEGRGMTGELLQDVGGGIKLSSVLLRSTGTWIPMETVLSVYKTNPAFGVNVIRKQAFDPDLLGTTQRIYNFKTKHDFRFKGSDNCPSTVHGWACLTVKRLAYRSKPYGNVKIVFNYLHYLVLEFLPVTKAKLYSQQHKLQS